jgi:hypothetical protein
MFAKPSVWKLAVAWVVSVLVVAAAASMLTSAQTANDKKVVSGSDLGFRIDSERGGVPTGRFVVRVNGNWVELKEQPGVSRLTQ